MRRAVVVTFLALLAPEAFAHGDGLPISPAEFWHHWVFDPMVLIPLLAAHWFYGRGVMRAWRRAGVGRVIPIWRVASFVLGELALIIALITPLDPLGETLLSAHMAQHILLTAIAPPLLVAGLPLLAWTWALPTSWRRIGTTSAARSIAYMLDIVCRPSIAILISVAVMWIWHAPALFEAALADEGLHAVEHATFFIGALLAWRAALSKHSSAIVAVGVTFVVFMTSGMLGGLLSLAPVPLYDWYGNRAQLWGMTPLEDQQIAGLLMWVAAGGVYLAAFAVFAFRASDPSRTGRSRPSHGIIRASTSSRSTK